MNSYLSAMRSFRDFTGRTSRGDYWRFILVYLGIAVIALMLDAAFATGNKDGGLFIGLVHLIHLVPQVAAGIRRMHDTDHSGWWLLLSPVALVFACFAGTPGPNRFGPPPAAGAVPASIGAAPSAPVPAQPLAQPQRDVIAEIERLAQLRAGGSVSEAEFEVMKAQALSQARGA
ncbi:DUF805 domain-containing protein [Methylobacterium bullatum]|uniref:DUF805 domain-containing protein n=1 Tax=Methylobacterium bullatum TaxID=570505 RepID=A0AAV4Z9T6_9HYPH|nr:DUF805 domain-containing protein [Methylobacterium bullatum]MBD8902560.1 hypothetical protein [Methylobacterium bullatum]GJD40337.1 hypothetical protein OICFNHDK_2806 [Methylobacterium bullatum]